MRRRLRLFLDSNVLTGGMVARRGLDKAILSICAARVCRLVLAEAVREEVEHNILMHASKLSAAESNTILIEYTDLLKLADPEIIPFPLEADVMVSRHIIRQAPDVPVLMSAIDAQPDWLLTHNTKHFTPEVAAATGLRITTPIEFFKHFAQGIREISAR
jgi:predicted nucleic acid-binding protein